MTAPTQQQVMAAVVAAHDTAAAFYGVPTIAAQIAAAVAPVLAALDTANATLAKARLDEAQLRADLGA